MSKAPLVYGETETFHADLYNKILTKYWELEKYGNSPETVNNTVISAAIRAVVSYLIACNIPTDKLLGTMNYYVKAAIEYATTNRVEDSN